jgi:hypothetical protein
MTQEMFWFAMVLGLVVQGGVIYAAVRLALTHDRAARARADTRVADAARWKARADQARHAAQTEQAATPAGAPGT